MRSALVTHGNDVDDASNALRMQPMMTGAALAAKVSTRQPYVWSDGPVRVAVVDYGVKRSILRRLAGAGIAVTVFPHDVDAETLAAFDGVLLSNGPGDPEPLDSRGRDDPRVARARAGARHLSRPSAARTRNRAARRSSFRSGIAAATIRCWNARAGRVLVTSQNHGFAVAPSADRAATHESLYDGTVEGLSYPELRARSVQFHPEAGPGPHDAWPILADWVEEVQLAAA